MQEVKCLFMQEVKFLFQEQLWGYIYFLRLITNVGFTIYPKVKPKLIAKLGNQNDRRAPLQQ